jgi:DUF2950 family protein
MIKRLTFSILIAAGVLLPAETARPQTFGSAEEAVDALVGAAKNGMNAVRTFFGPGSAEILRTGDEIEDKVVLDRFNHLAAEKTTLEPDPMNPDRKRLALGSIEWPFAIPLVRKNGRWYWDIQEGKAEIRHRTIGGNELDAIEICRGYVEAQEIYAQTDWDQSGALQYAKRIVSTQGRKDGLYWAGDDSPVAAAFAKAAAQGYTPSTGAPKPYHGYFFKVLLGQGPDAPGGATDYVVHGLMIGGFALIAWPAEYGVSGIKTFMVNQDGVVYEKDLGPQTATLAKGITKYNPTSSWLVSPDITEP